MSEKRNNLDNMIKVINGILCNKHCEDGCCADIESVQDYARACQEEDDSYVGGFNDGINLSDEEAELIMIYCQTRLARCRKEEEDEENNIDTKKTEWVIDLYN